LRKAMAGEAVAHAAPGTPELTQSAA